MKKILIILIIIGFAYYVVNRQSNTVEIDISNEQIIKDKQDLKATFSLIDSYYSSYMIFGGNADHKLRNSFSDFSLAALPIEMASSIAQQYPDFHMCKSPGASMAQGKIQTLSLIAKNNQVANVLEEVLSLHNESIYDDGERVCIELEGSSIEPEKMIHKDTNTDVSKDVIPSLSNLDYYFIESASIVECTSLL